MKILKLTILDHGLAQGTQGPEDLTFNVVGILVSETPDYLQLANWVHSSGADDENTESFRS